jgi:hypothetical protein
MVIFPEIRVTPDSPTVMFYQPREKVNLDQELPRILATQGWGCGTYFNVQFLNHEKTKLLACARFVVSEESESVRTSSADPYQPVTKTVFSRKADQIGDWWIPESADEEPAESPSAASSADEITATVRRRGRPPKQATG